MPVLLQDTINLQDTLGLTGRLPAVDTLAGDSIASIAGAAPVEIWDAAAVYGPQSVKIAENVVETAAGPALLTANGWFQILSLIVLALWCWMIYWYRDQAGMCLKGLVNFKPEDKFTAEHGHLYNRFVNFAMAVMVAATGIMVVKMITAAVDPGRLAQLPGWLIAPAAVIIAALAAAVIALQFGALKLAGEVTLSQELTEEVAQVKKSHLAAAAILVVPAVLLYTGSNPVWDAILEYIVIFEAVAITLAFAVKTCILFVRQKVSLLVWFLYLCAVEIFPLSLIALLAMKNV